MADVSTARSAKPQSQSRSSRSSKVQTPKTRQRASAKQKAASPQARASAKKPTERKKQRPVLDMSDEARRKRARPILRLLNRYYADAECALVHNNAFELLIATILSAQCTDERVNQVTPGLFRRYPTPQAFAAAKLSELEDAIRSTGFFRNKARNIKSCSQDLVGKYNGDLPKNMGDMTALAGVGRKTANVVLGNAFGIPGLVVDTHVTRLSNRLGMASGKNAVKLEKDLEKVVPKKHWIDFSHWLIQHGRQVCKARRPQCEVCFLFEHCPRVGLP